ncbi:hypothetical protein POM88_050940 [Heracleum sosnowskyi]|uniref:Uncharacterized protein n=1 Tax=Heracleum sosnowskyi TaxID=360622 RepID=A0AAD8GZJ9_9APIA|nr:hypothetical protein POM88_050940 [Heracleum sosnowskyi]
MGKCSCSLFSWEGNTGELFSAITCVTEEDRPMLECVKSFVSLADRVRCFEKLFMEFNCHFAGCEGCEGLLSAISNHTDEMNSYPAEFRIRDNSMCKFFLKFSCRGVLYAEDLLEICLGRNSADRYSHVP